MFIPLSTQLKLSNKSILPNKLFIFIIFKFQAKQYIFHKIHYFRLLLYRISS